MALVFAHLSQLLPMAQPFAGGCPDFLITQAARLAAVEMCERTRCWRHVMSFEPDAPTTDNLIPVEAVIWEIEAAEIDGNHLTPTQHTAVMLGADAIGPPRYISQTNPWGILLHPWQPDVPAGTLTLSVFLKPRTDVLIGLDADNPLLDTLNVAPEWMIQQHAERLVDGALGRVMFMQGQPWFNPQLGAAHLARFEQGLDRQFRSNMRGQQRARIRTEYHDF